MIIERRMRVACHRFLLRWIQLKLSLIKLGLQM
jgi:hypothetical protein